ncbi:hypothetical protein [Pseudomonas serbica]|jgi:hypothetical protein|uniref:hypothetical protein n=1 Tax=Pseudomonas serbica TaxID=2965074 RepID=UPI00237B52C9|nr:hypothetical protein [Pseudomonas serbica]
MPSNNLFYQAALAQFVKNNHAKLAQLYGGDADGLSQYDLELILDQTAGQTLRLVFEYNGRFDQFTLNELALMPASKRNLEVAAKLMARHEVSLMMNTPLYKAMASRPAYGKILGERVDEWRMKRMRETFQKITKTSQQVERNTHRLKVAMKNFVDNPSKHNKMKVNVAVKSLKKSLVASHYQAKSGAAWALRAGFSAHAVAKSLNGLYLKKMAKMASSFGKVDNWLEHHGIKNDISAGIDRRRKIVIRDLRLADADPEYQGLQKFKALLKTRLTNSNEGLVYA